MNKVISIVVVLVVVVGGFLMFKNRSVAPTEIEETVKTVETSAEPVGEVKEFVVETGSYYFAPKTMSVKEGDTVKITLKNAGGYHDLKLDEFGVATKTLKSEGEQDVVTFVASKKGTFEYYCSIGKHRQMGMVGTLTVE